MIFTLALLVFISAITVAFSKEFGGLFKKFFAIPGVKLILPLLIMTLLVIHFEPWVLWALLYIKFTLHSSIDWLAALLPFETGAKIIASVLLMMGITILPVIAFNAWIKYKTYQNYHHDWLLSLFIWLLLSTLLSVSLVY